MRSRVNYVVLAAAAALLGSITPARAAPGGRVYLGTNGRGIVFGDPKPMVG